MSKIPNDDEAIFIAAASPEVDMDRISDLSYRPAVQPPPLIRAVRQFLNSLGPEGLRAYREIGGFGYCPVCDESNGHAPTCSYLLLILENNRSLEQWVKGATLLGLSPDLSALEGAVPMSKTVVLKPPLKWEPGIGLLEDRAFRRWTPAQIKAMTNGTYDWKNHQEVPVNSRG